MNIHPFSLLCHIALGSAFQSFANLTNADEACETIICLEERKVDGRLRRDSFTLFAAISYYVSTCHHAVGVPWAFAEYWSYFTTASKAWAREKVVQLKPD